MPMLQRLNITMDFEKGGVQVLLRGFCKGASPHLLALNIPLSFDFKNGECFGERVEGKSILQIGIYLYHS